MYPSNGLVRHFGRLKMASNDFRVNCLIKRKFHEVDIGSMGTTHVGHPAAKPSTAGNKDSGTIWESTGERCIKGCCSRADYQEQVIFSLEYGLEQIDAMVVNGNEALPIVGNHGSACGLDDLRSAARRARGEKM